MKNIFKTLALTTMMALSSCSGSKMSLYLNSEPVAWDKVSIKISKVYEMTSLYRETDVTISFISSDPKPVTLKFKDWKVYREKDKAEYSAGCLTAAIYGEITLNCDIEKTLTFEVELPTSTKEERYKLVINFTNKSLICYLYDKPSE